MTKQRKLNVKIVAVIAAIVLFGILAYSLFWLSRERFTPTFLAHIYPQDHYTIDPNTIIPSLDNGTINVFSPAPEVGDFLPDNTAYFQWHQSDFIKIASALNRFAGKDNIDDWKIVFVYLISECEDKGNGFSSGTFFLYRTTWIQGQPQYEVREISIHPRASIVAWGSGTYASPMHGSIPLDKFKITAEQALMIAEEHGGRQIRANKKYRCSVSVMGEARHWRVMYDSAEYLIDAYTGEITDIHKYRDMTTPTSSVKYPYFEMKLRTLVGA